MHRRMDKCKIVSERKRRRLFAEEEREVTAKACSAYGYPLEMVTSIRYLLRVILAEGDEWPVVVRNLYRARAVCKTMTRIISREGE